MYNFFKIILIQYFVAFLPAVVAANINCFRLCLSESKITNVHPILILTIIFENVLRTFEAEILKTFSQFKNIQPQPNFYLEPSLMFPLQKKHLLFCVIT